MGDKLCLDNLPEERYKLGSKIGSGVWGILYEAEDNKNGRIIFIFFQGWFHPLFIGKRVAIKVVNLSNERVDDVREEYKVYNSLPPHPNVANFYGLYRKQGRADIQQAWVITEVQNTYRVF